MSERERSLNGSRLGSRSNLGFSTLKSKQLVQSHLRSIMPSLQGGKEDHEIKYIRLRVHDSLEKDKSLEKLLRPILDESCGEFYDYKVFKHTDEILNESINEQDIYYLFLKEDLASWGERFSKQELKQSEGRRSIFIVQFLRKNKFMEKIQERKKIVQKKGRDPMEKIIYFINLEGNVMEELEETVLLDMEAKLKNKLRREGDRVKTWALANKFKQKSAKKQRLYVYIEEILMDKLAAVYRKFSKKNGFKWTQIVKFSSFKDIMESVHKREVDLNQQQSLQSQMSINPVSKIFDSNSQTAIKSLSIIRAKSQSNINPNISVLSSNKSFKDIVQDKTEHNLRNFDQNFIIHSLGFEEADKIYQYVMSHKDNNWQRVIYEDKNYAELDQLLKQIEKNEKQNDGDRYMRIINAKELYIITYEGDMETDAIYNSLNNNFNNRFLLGYESENELLGLLYQFARNEDNFTIVVIYQQGSSEDSAVADFIEKNKSIGDFDNLIVKYKRHNDINMSLSMNSKMSIYDERDAEKFLRAVMEDRDRNFDPFNCYANNYVYLLYRYDKQWLIDEGLRKLVSNSARLKKAPYQDENYLQMFLKGVERSGDHGIIITDDKCLREAQQVAKKFNQVYIMNVTERKNVKPEIKVMAWGPHSSIKNVLAKIEEKIKISERREYKKAGGEVFAENPIPRRVPKNIEFKQGNNITLKLSSQETNPDSEVMEDNLAHYFKEEIRVENYLKPEEIRLVNKVEEPLTFIICRDTPEELEYMKAIAKEERDDLRQEYILYTEKPEQYFKTLFNNDKYERFRFISNSWRKIEEYIIGLYQKIRGIRNEQNDSIYEDELVHIFYHPEDAHLADHFTQNYAQTKIYPFVRLHQLGELEWTALQQSPHHLYYVLVDELAGRFRMADARAEVTRVQRLLEARQVAPKRIRMLVVGKNAGAMRDQYLQGIFEEQKLALDYLANTRVLKPKYEVNRPHIIIDKGSLQWYYFLNKHLSKDRYYLHYANSIQDAAQMIVRTRANEVGSQFWYLTSSQKDLKQFLEAASRIEGGMKIYGLFHGSPSNVSPSKIKFAHEDHQQVEAFILNSHKRSQTIFSPESLRKRNPVLAMSKATAAKVPIHESEIRKWKQDLGAEEFYFDNPAELKSIATSKNIFLIVDNEEDKKVKAMPDLPANIWRIVFDSNASSRNKAHSLVYLSNSSKQSYFGHYPAEIRHYLRYLRYNIKNPPEKLKQTHSKQLINIYIEKGLSLTAQEAQNIFKNNHSIVNIFSVENNKAAMQNAINHSSGFPDYSTIMVLSKGGAATLEALPNRKHVNYIIYDEQFRKNGHQVTHSELLTDEKPEYITYLNNLPENRYNKALQYRGKDSLSLMYLSTDGRLQGQVDQLREINKRNTNFTLTPYSNINQLKQTSQNVVILVDKNGYDQHLDQLKYRENISYFILDTNKDKNLHADSSRSEHFLTKEELELYGYFNNLRRLNETPNAIRFPTIFVPQIIDKIARANISGPIAFKSNMNLSKLRVLPPFKPRTEINFYQHNLLDSAKPEVFALPPSFGPDYPMAPESIQNYLPKNPGRPLKLNLDFPPSVIQDKFNSKADIITIVPSQIRKPTPKQLERNLAIVYPDSAQYREVFRMLSENLKPRSFAKVDGFAYGSDFDFENLYRNESKFRGYDRTVILITPRMSRYAESLSSIQRKMKNKMNFYVFSDYFDQSYAGFRSFLQPYTISPQPLPYVNSRDPRFWLSTNLYNVLVPLNKKKKYDALKRSNVIVTPYSSESDIENQLHRNEEFVIIVCDKRDFHRFKKYPWLSPRCVLVLEDASGLEQDEVALFRYMKKVLYYGPDAFTYLLKTRIPTKTLPFKSESMKVLFFNQGLKQEKQLAEYDDFDEYEKVPYDSSEDLFIKLIQKFKSSINYKFPANTLTNKDLIRLHPKIYIQKQANYMSQYLKQYSTLQSIHEKEYNRSFKNLIKPWQYSHLPIKEYESGKELRQMLEHEESPCLVYYDSNNQEHLRICREMQARHLFIGMFDLYDMWIDRDGYLVDSEKLARQQLATKQTLFTQMFNRDVFDTYNDMRYFYLSNTSIYDQVRQITFMDREQLYELYSKEPNLLMIIFVEHSNRQFIPQQFYDPLRDESKQDRVKLIFVHNVFVDNRQTMYAKYNEIDPIIKHINRVEVACRVDFCLYPANQVGNILWHRFAQKAGGFKPREYSNMGEIDSIAQDIKGNFREVCVICQKDEEPFIRKVFEHYSIKTKHQQGQKLNFIHISQADNRSFVIPYSNIKNSNINFNEASEDNDEKFERVGNPIDVNGNNLLTPRSAQKPTRNKQQKLPVNSLSLDDIIQSKQFVLNINQKLRDFVSVGNLYANKVNYFRALNGIDKNSSLSQLILTNQNLGEIRALINRSPNHFLIYISDQIAEGSDGNMVIINEAELPRFISGLEEIQRAGANHLTEAKLKSNQQEIPALARELPTATRETPTKNLQDFKRIRIFYDENIDPGTKKQILLASVKNKNMQPQLFRDFETLKKLMKEEGSLSLLLISKEPPNFEKQVAKQNFKVLKNKKTKLLVPKNFNSVINGLSTILQENESELEALYSGTLNDDIHVLLTMMENNPEKGRKTFLPLAVSSSAPAEEPANPWLQQNQQESDDKLNLHSNINMEGNLELTANRQWIRQRLDGGVIVLYVDKNSVEEVEDIKRKYNVLVQQYSHTLNLGNSIRDKRDKFTLVIVEPHMLPEIGNIKQQYPKTVIVLLNKDRRDILPTDRNNISYEISKIAEFGPIMAEIYEQNEKIKYSEHGKILSKMDNKKASYVDNGNSYRLSMGYNNTKTKNAFVFYKDQKNKSIINRVQGILPHITFVAYLDFADAQKKCSLYGGYPIVFIANDQEIPLFEDFVLKRKQQAYLIKLNPSSEYRENPKTRKNSLQYAYSDNQVSEFLIKQFGEFSSSTVDQSREKYRQGKNYSPRYQPNTFGTTPRFSNQKDFVPYKNDPIYSSRGTKSTSRQSKLVRADGLSRELSPRVPTSPSYNR